MFGRSKNSGKRTKSLEEHAITVENILDTLNIDINEARLNTETGFGWTFRRGSAIIEVYITEHGTQGHIQVLAPIQILPESGLLPLYRHLLELNLQLTNASLGVFYDVVYVFNERPLLGLDAEEANAIITMVAGYADELDNALVNEFGGRLYSQI